MLVAQHLGIRQSTCIIDTRMIFTIIQNIIVLTTNGRNNRKIGLKTCTTCHCSLIPRKTRQCLLQLKMQIQCSIQKTTTRNTCTILIQRFVSSLNHYRILSKAQIVITTEHYSTFTLHIHNGCLTRFQCMKVRINTTTLHFFKKIVVTFLKNISHLFCLLI